MAKRRNAAVSAAILLFLCFPSKNGCDAKNEAEDHEEHSEQHNAVGPHLRNMVQQE